jgi:hypothetical protein
MLHKHLHKIQKELKSPKSQRNSFGKYNYRSCEDIVEAVKPLLPEGVSLMLSDTVEQIGHRFYIKATATLTDGSGDGVHVSAYAREPEDKKGMDASQITGAASSYARKYALNGLFAIDDTKDADTDENKVESDARPSKPAWVFKPNDDFATEKEMQGWVTNICANIKGCKSREELDVITKQDAGNVRKLGYLKPETFAHVNNIVAAKAKEFRYGV